MLWLHGRRAIQPGNPEGAMGHRDDPHIDRAHGATAETTDLAVLERA